MSFNSTNPNVNPIWGQEVPSNAQSLSQFVRIADEDKCYQTEGEVYKLYLATGDGAPRDPSNAGNDVMIPINIPTIKTLPEGSVVYLTSIQIDSAPSPMGYFDLRSDTFVDSQRYESATGKTSNILKRIAPIETLQIFDDVRNTSGTTIRSGQALNFQQVHILITDDRGDPIALAGTGGDQAFVELTIIAPYSKKY